MPARERVSQAASERLQEQAWPLCGVTGAVALGGKLRRDRGSPTFLPIPRLAHSVQHEHLWAGRAPDRGTHAVQDEPE